MHDPSLEKPHNRTVQVAVVAVAVIVLSGGYYWHSHHTAQATMPANVQGPPPVTEASIEHPLPPEAAPAASKPLPDLNDSDKALADAIEGAGGADVRSYLVADNIVRHIVVTVDNIDRQKLTVDKRPLTATPGSFQVQGDEMHATLDAQNYQRYHPFIEVLQKADMRRLTAVYVHFYPLLQKAYQDLGYPNAYFNDRLVKAIDSLLATPQVAQPIELVRPNVMYLFVDPLLEALPAGQKVLLRMGPGNAAVVKAKLGELRAAITAAAPAAASAAAER